MTTENTTSITLETMLKCKQEQISENLAWVAMMKAKCNANLEFLTLTSHVRETKRCAISNEVNISQSSISVHLPGYNSKRSS